MIVKTKNTEKFKQYHGQLMTVDIPSPGADSWQSLQGAPVQENAIIVVETSKIDLNKCQVGLKNSEVAGLSFHVSALSPGLPCACAFVRLIHLVKMIDPEAGITCGGTDCGIPGWEATLKKLIPCKGLKDIENKKQLDALKTIKNFGFGLESLKTKKPWPGVSSKPTPKKPAGPMEVVDFPGEYPLVPGTLEKIPAVGGSSKYVRSVHGAVFNFYALEEASLADVLPPVFRERHKEFVESTARTMFDYLASICLTEARHAYQVEWNIYGAGNQLKSRSNSWLLGRQYNPRQFLHVCKWLFENANFSGGYGGPAWAKIASCALKYFDLPVKAWFDHVVDLAHNGGLAFNKGVFWYQPANSNSYLAMLSRKKQGSVLDDSQHDTQQFASTHGEMRWLLYCAGLIDVPGPKCPPLKWGDKEIVIKTNVMSAATDDNDEAEAEAQQLMSGTKPERIL